MPRVQPEFLPAALARDSLESLHALHGASRPWIYWIMLATAGAGFVALPLIEIDVGVRAGGLVRPAIERNELRAPVGGLIAEVRVRDGAAVQQGDVLLVVTAPALDERISYNATRAHELANQILDLEAVLRHAADSTGVLANARFNAGPSELAGAPTIELPVDSFSTAARGQEYSQLLVQLGGLEQKLRRAQRESERALALHKAGLVTDRERDEARFGVENIATEALILLRQTSARWQAELAERLSQRAALVADARQLADEKALHAIRAPIDGALTWLTGLAPGGYVVSGQPLAQLSPDEALHVECAIATRDIGLVREGQPARLQFDALPHTLWGTLDGAIANVAADHATGGNHAAGFRAIVTLPRTHLALASGVRGELRKGMTATVRLIVARRSLFALLYQDAADWLRP